MNYLFLKKSFFVIFLSMVMMSLLSYNTGFLVNFTIYCLDSLIVKLINLISRKEVLGSFAIVFSFIFNDLQGIFWEQRSLIGVLETIILLHMVYLLLSYAVLKNKIGTNLRILLIHTFHIHVQ